MKAPVFVFILVSSFLLLIISPLLITFLTKDPDMGFRRGSKPVPEAHVNNMLADLERKTKLPKLPPEARDIEIWSWGATLHTRYVFLYFKLDETLLDQWVEKIPKSYQRYDDVISYAQRERSLGGGEDGHFYFKNKSSISFTFDFN